jgi:hypothetical protein
LAEKVAPTALEALIVTVQLPVPEHSLPDQPVKVEPAAALAASVTAVPLAKVASADAQFESQLMPTGEDVTVPLPVPTLVRERV